MTEDTGSLLQDAIKPRSLVWGGNVEVKLGCVRQRDPVQNHPGVSGAKPVYIVHSNQVSGSAQQCDGGNDPQTQRWASSINVCLQGAIKILRTDRGGEVKIP